MAVDTDVRPGVSGGRRAGDRQLAHLNCPRCGLTIRPRVGWLAIEHCPRCLARRRVAVPLFASTLPAAELYATGAAPEEGKQHAPTTKGGL